MKTKLFLLSLIGAAVCMSSCEHGKGVSADQENDIINIVYQSLDSTPEQFNNRMKQQGLHEVSKSSKGMTFSNIYNDYDDQILLNIAYNGNKINRIVYERYLNKESNLSGYYRQFSIMIAEHGYTEWQGYYKDPATREDIGNILWWKDYSSGQKVENTQELYSTIKNDNLVGLNNLQFFLEIFTYTHSNQDQWTGQIFLYTDHYFSGINEDDGGTIKDIHLNFILERK